MSVYVSGLCCQSFLRRSDHLYRNVLWISVCCECCVSSGKCLCDGLIPFTEESYGRVSVMIVVCCQVEFCETG